MGKQRADEMFPHRRPARRDVEFHLTLRAEDRELLDALAERMGCSRTETISRALHLLKAMHEKGHGAAD